MFWSEKSAKLLLWKVGIVNSNENRTPKIKWKEFNEQTVRRDICVRTRRTDEGTENISVNKNTFLIFSCSLSLVKGLMNNSFLMDEYIPFPLHPANYTRILLFSHLSYWLRNICSLWCNLRWFSKMSKWEMRVKLPECKKWHFEWLISSLIWYISKF